MFVVLKLNFSARIFPYPVWEKKLTGIPMFFYKQRRLPTNTGLAHKRVAPPLQIVISYDSQKALRVELLDAYVVCIARRNISLVIIESCSPKLAVAVVFVELNKYNFSPTEEVKYPVLSFFWKMRQRGFSLVRIVI